MSDVCAGIVTYNPEMKLFEQCLESIRTQVDKVYIFDNGSSNKNELNRYAKDEKIVILYSPKNLGIAKALNELCKKAQSEGYSWIVTMDQDSICKDDMVVELMKYSPNEKYGIICPRVEFRTNNQLLHETREKRDIAEIRACITSGSLTRISAWENVNGFDEWMFIDHVDNEFCTHLYTRGYSVVRVDSAVLYQRAGDMKYIKLPLKKKLLLPYYSEFRNYYICRNTLYYSRKYKKIINAKHEIMVLIYLEFRKLIFEKNRINTIKSCFRGIRDGLAKEIEE